MSDPRRPDWTFSVRKKGKRREMKVELFRITQWPRRKFRCLGGGEVSDVPERYRIRCKGRWFRLEDGTDYCVTWYQFRDLLWNSLKKVRKE